MNELKIKTNKRNEMIDITDMIQDYISKKDIENGFTIIYTPHTTAAVTINEGADPSVQRDIIKKLENIIPKNDDYHHSEGNSDAHIKSSIIGVSEMVFIENKKLVLGTWQSIYFYEGDGPRTRKIYVDIFKK